MTDRESDVGIDQNRVIVFDTTLRDGEQSPGATLTSEEKLEVADALVALGRCDRKQASSRFAGRFRGSARDRAALERRDHRRAPPRANEGHQARRDGGEERPSARIHTFIATSDIHLKA